MSRTLLSLAGFQVIITGRFWVIAEDWLGAALFPVKIDGKLYEIPIEIGKKPNR
jgi:hypothetical protein